MPRASQRLPGRLGAERPGIIVRGSLFTKDQLARRFVEALSRKSLADLQIKSWKEYR